MINDGSRLWRETAADSTNLCRGPDLYLRCTGIYSRLVDLQSVSRHIVQSISRSTYV